MHVQDGASLATAVAVAFGLSLLAAGCGGGSLRIVAAVTPLPTLSARGCVTFISQQSGGTSVQRRVYARTLCAREASGAKWYHVKVTNTGGRTTWVTCTVVAYDLHGRKMWTAPIPLAPGGLPFAAADLAAGKSSALTWFIPYSGIGPHPLRGPVRRYDPLCHAIKTPPV